MKTIFKVMAAISGLGIVILFILHIFLQYGLTKAMRDVILPEMREELGVDVQVEKLSINVPNGRLYLKKLEVKNPDGFVLENLLAVDKVIIEADLWSLLKNKLIFLEHIEVEGALLNVIRDKEGVLNLNALQEDWTLATTDPNAPVITSPSEPMPEIETTRPDHYPEIEMPPAEPAPTEAPAPKKQPTLAKKKPPTEMLIKAIQSKLTVRYIDFKLNQLDLALDLNVIGSNLSTQRDPNIEWGKVSIIGALAHKENQFITDLNLHLAPIVKQRPLSFDLTGKMMEIDPKIMDELYSKLGVRSAPFSLEPNLHCRSGWYEKSAVRLHLKEVVFEEKLSKRLGGMASVDALKFNVPLEGELLSPRVDVQSALSGALSDNAGSLLNSLLEGFINDNIGSENPTNSIREAVTEEVTEHVEKISDSKTLKKVLNDLANDDDSDTNSTLIISTENLVDLLGEEVKELSENEEIKDELKSIGKLLFGN